MIIIIATTHTYCSEFVVGCRTTFTNCTSQEQEYSLKTSRTTRSTCDIQVGILDNKNKKEVYWQLKSWIHTTQYNIKAPYLGPNGKIVQYCEHDLIIDPHITLYTKCHKCCTIRTLQ